MIERHQEADILRSLAEAYQDVVEAAKGKLGGGAGDNMQGARAAQGGGRLGVFTPARGMGAKKEIKNDPNADDKRAAKQKAQAEDDRNAENKDKFGVSPAERKERARVNKENKAKAGIDDVLKDLRGK